MKRCELCSHPASMYCESDLASLCWECDEKVHSANFLVAKHSRCLLCHKCQSVTPWNASGVKLGRTLSACVACVDKQDTVVKRQREIYQRRNDQDEDEDSDSDSDSDDEEIDEDGENQIVPWSCNPPSSPPITSSSTSEKSSSSRLSSGGPSVPKRRRQDANLDTEEDDTGCSSPRLHGEAATTEIMSFRASEDNEVTSLRSFRALKVIRSERILDRSEAESKMASVANSLKRFWPGTVGAVNDASQTILGNVN